MHGIRIVFRGLKIGFVRLDEPTNGFNPLIDLKKLIVVTIKVD